MIGRREFVALFGGAAAAWPLAASAQQPAVPVIGYLTSGSPNASASFVAAFQQGLNEMGFVEHRNVGFDYRWAEGRYDRLPALAAGLVERRVTVIAAGGGAAPALAAKAATTTIPIVFFALTYPVKLGLVASLNRPGGNVTGASWLSGELGSKRLEFLRELVPQATTLALLVNPTGPAADLQTADVQEAARTLGLELLILHATSEGDFVEAFGSLARQGVAALMVAADPFFDSRRDRLIELAAQHRVPAIYQFREYAVAGGLISYGSSVAEAHRQAGVYTGRILKGERPADLPVTQPTKFELVINLKTAKALGISMPPTLLAIADEVIE
jgi:putative ABC transport system substrate-binding protein